MAQNLSNDISLKARPRGHYQPGDLADLLYPGNVIIIEPTKGQKQTYISLSGASAEGMLLNPETQQYVSINTALQGDIAIRNASTLERRNVESLYPDIVNKQQMIQKLRKDPNVKGIITKEVTLDASSLKPHSSLATDNVPDIVLGKISEKLAKSVNTAQAKTVFMERDYNSKKLAVINTSALERLQAEYQRLNLSDAHSLKQYEGIKDKLNTDAKKIHDVVFSMAKDRRKYNLNQMINEITDHTKTTGDYVYEYENQTNDFNRLVVTKDSTVDTFAKETQKTFQELEAERAGRKDILVSTGDNKKDYLRVVSRYGQREQVANVLEGLNQVLANHDIRSQTINSYGQAIASSVAKDQFAKNFQTYYQRALITLDAHFKTNVSKTHYFESPDIFSVLNVNDAAALTGTNDLNTRASISSSASLQKMSTSASDAVNELELRRLGLGPEITAKRLGEVGAMRTYMKANAAALGVESINIQRRIEEILPAYEQNSLRNRYPKSTMQATGIMSMASGLMGAYFYQELIYGWSRKISEMFRTFIDPGQIIEAKQHSSAETSARRMMMTDFGSKWSYIHTFAGLIEGSMAEGGGKSLFGYFRSLVEKYGVNEVQAKGDLVGTLRKVEDDITQKLHKVIGQGHDAAISKFDLKKTAEHAGDHIDQFVDYLSRNRKAVIISTGGGILLSRIGSSVKQEEDKKFISDRRKRISQNEYLRSNHVMPSHIYSSMLNVEGRTYAGFASPFEPRAMAWLERIRSATTAFSESTLVKRIREGGLTFSKRVSSGTAGAKQATSFMQSLREAGTFAAGATTGLGEAAVAIGNYVSRLAKEAIGIGSSLEATTLARGSEETLYRHAKVQELNKSLAETGERVTQTQNQLKDIPAQGFSKEPYHVNKEVTAQPILDKVNKQTVRDRSLNKKQRFASNKVHEHYHSQHTQNIDSQTTSLKMTKPDRSSAWTMRDDNFFSPHRGKKYYGPDFNPEDIQPPKITKVTPKIDPVKMKGVWGESASKFSVVERIGKAGSSVWNNKGKITKHLVGMAAMYGAGKLLARVPDVAIDQLERYRDMTQLDFGGPNMAPMLTTEASTERQRALQAIEEAKMNANYIFGSEADRYH